MARSLKIDFKKLSWVMGMGSLSDPLSKCEQRIITIGKAQERGTFSSYCACAYLTTVELTQSFNQIVCSTVLLIQYSSEFLKWSLPLHVSFCA